MPSGTSFVRTLFLSTPSARRATRAGGRGQRHQAISIHALCEEGDYSSTVHLRVCTISIHALCEEGDSSALAVSCVSCYFYPRPLRGGRRRCRPPWRPPYNFYPRPLRGGRPPALRESSASLLFLSTPSARRATAKTETKSLFSNKLYNILHEFRRALIYNGSKSYPNHAK